MENEDPQATLAETNRRLDARLQELNTIYTVGRSVTASLDVEEILGRVVVPAVNLTRAEEGFIILQEQDRLLLRVSSDGRAALSDLPRVEVEDKVARQVIRSGRPVMLQRETEVADGRLARTLLYVPLRAPGSGTMGILGVVNRTEAVPFTEHQLFVLSTMADFAAIAVENARLFSVSEAERSKLNAVLKYAAEAIVVTDEENHLWFWSETATHLFKIEPRHRGQPLGACITNSDLCGLFEHVKEDGAVIRSEIMTADGRVYNAQVSKISGVGRVAVMQEITHLKELDRLKSEFVSTVSHDLRTPLTTIQGYVELLDRAGPLTELQRSFVGKAISSLDYIGALISDLLDIGRIEAGYDLEMQCLRIDELVETAAEAALSSARDAEVSLSISPSEAPLRVWGDARRLRQVLDNLISNAIKYNRPGGWVRLEVLRDEDHVVVRVSDSGIGIPACEQAKIFERFYRVQGPETERIRGTGLGLAIVKSVIEKHQGRVWVDSTLGQGSTFTFVLPIHTT
ncbi:MAG: ATP-binding protein [Anaerolineae bacterium]